MNNQVATKENINKLIEFRQAVYARVFQARRDALFETLDALLASGAFSSFAYLSQSERFRRRWPSLYQAVEDGRIDSNELRTLVAAHLPVSGVCVFPLDSSAWPRPRSRVLEDLQYAYQASSDVNGGTVTVGYPYSLLEWCAEAHTRWSLPVDVRRVSSRETVQAVGAAQIRSLAQARQDCVEALDIVPADGKYGNARFLQQVQGLRVGILVRLRSDRVFYRPAPPPSGGRGRPRKHGARFDCKDEQTWGEPDEVQEFEHARYGKVKVQLWCGLHDRRAPQMTFALLRAQVHLEKAEPPKAVWFLWLPPAQMPASVSVTAKTLWTDYVNRWPIEPGIRFRKENLGWTLPRFQSAETGDTWTLLVTLAHWMLFLARPLVKDSPLPWQKTQPALTPQRVRQSLWTIFAHIGTPALPPKPRGPPPAGQRARQERPNNVTKWSKRASPQPKPLEIRLVRCCFDPDATVRARPFV